MSQRSEHTQRKSVQEPITIQGIWLDAHSGRIKVRAEVNGVWLNVIDVPNIDQGHISHIVEPSGILNSKPASELG